MKQVSIVGMGFGFVVATSGVAAFREPASTTFVGR